MNECTCRVVEAHYPAAFHDEDCPRWQRQCSHCDGEGRITVPVGCGCCHESEDCDWCDGTGNEQQEIAAGP